MENIYCKILDIFFCSMIYTACHDYNCFLVLGCLLNAMIILCCNSFFLFNLQKMPVRGLHKISFLSGTRLWIYLNLFFDQRPAIVLHLLMFLHILTVFLHTYIYIQTVHIWRFLMRKKHQERGTASQENELEGKYSVWMNSVFFFQICNNIYMCTHACVYTPMHPHTQIFSLQHTENKAHKASLLFSTFPKELFILISSYHHFKFKLLVLTYKKLISFHSLCVLYCF